MKKDKFWNWLAKNYDDEVGEQTTELTKKYLSKNDTVLDYGCARGAYTIALAGDVKEIRGIDISSKMIEIAKNKSKDISFKKPQYLTLMKNMMWSWHSISCISWKIQKR